MQRTIELLASQDYDQVIRADIDLSCEVGESWFDSIKEAKARLKCLVEDRPSLRYAQIRVNGECVYDWFAKGYNGEQEGEESQD